MGPVVLAEADAKTPFVHGLAKFETFLDSIKSVKADLVLLNVIVLSPWVPSFV